MALSKAEWKRRVEAAAALHGWELKDLIDPVAELAGDNFPRNAAARAGHESDNYQPNHALALILAELLGVPVEWFEEEDWRAVLQRRGSGTDEAIRGLRAKVDELVKQQADLVAAFNALRGDDPATALEQDEEAELRRRRADPNGQRTAEQGPEVESG